MFGLPDDVAYIDGVTPPAFIRGYGLSRHIPIHKWGSIMGAVQRGGGERFYSLSRRGGSSTIYNIYAGVRGAGVFVYRRAVPGPTPVPAMDEWGPWIFIVISAMLSVCYLRRGRTGAGHSG